MSMEKRKEIRMREEELVACRGEIFRTCFAERCKINEGISTRWHYNASLRSSS